MNVQHKARIQCTQTVGQCAFTHAHEKQRYRKDGAEGVYGDILPIEAHETVQLKLFLVREQDMAFGFLRAWKHEETDERWDR